MIKKLLLFALIIQGLCATAQVGINCQYIPAIQFGSVKVKTDNPVLGTYKYGAALPLMMLDRIGSKWYTNLDMNALYYGATQTNKAADGQIKIAKTEGGYFAGRFGRMFGKKETFRFGINANVGYSTSNLDSAKRTFDPRGYINFGGGLLVYKKINKKIRVAAKFGYEKYSAKGFITKGSGTYIETTVAYMVYQKYGLSIMPCIYSKNFQYTPKVADNPLANIPTVAKVSSVVFRIGLTKFL
jgi:hypothetical protein